MRLRGRLRTGLLNRMPAGQSAALWRGGSEVMKIYQSADAVVGVGGGYLQAPYLGQLWGRMAELKLAQRLGLPIFILGQSMGPFGAGALREYAREVLDGCVFVGPREAISRTRLDDLQVTAPTEIFPDTALALVEEAPASDGRKLIQRECGSDFHDNIVTVSVRAWGYGGRVDQAAFQTEIARALDTCIRELDVSVLFVSMCTNYGGYRVDDRYTSFDVWRRMAMRHRAQVLVEEYRRDEIMAILREAQLHIGMRLHSDLLALLAGTPCVAIEYEQKTSGILAQLGLGQQVVSMEDCDAATLTDLIDRTHAQRERILGTARQAIDTLAAQQRTMIDRIMDL